MPPPPMLSFTGDSSFELLKLSGGLGPVAIIWVTCLSIRPPISIHAGQICTRNAQHTVPALQTFLPEVLALAAELTRLCSAWPLATCRHNSHA